MGKKLLYTLWAINIVLLGMNFSALSGTTSGQASLQVYKTELPEESDTSSVDNNGEIILSEEDQIWALSNARTALEIFIESGGIYEPTDIPDIFLTNNNQVYISLYNMNIHDLIACQSSSGGSTLAEALIQSTIETIDDSRFTGTTLEDIDNTLIVINILNHEEKIKDTKNEYEVELGVDGIMLKQDGTIKATYLPNVPITSNKDHEKTYEDLCKKAGLDKTCTEDEGNSFYKFTTFTFMENGSDGSTFLTRYNNYLDDIDREDVENMLASTGEWLNNKTQENGKFKYLYYPSEDSYSSGYNIVRHVGSTYALLAMYEYTEDPEYLENAEKAINYLSEYIVYEDDMAYITDTDNAKVGTTALGVVVAEKAYELTGDEAYLTLSDQFGAFILAMQKADGSFKNYYPEEDPEDIAGYEVYGAESNLALSRLYARTGATKYLSALQLSYEYSSQYFAENHTTWTISWDTMAFSELYYITENERYAEFAYDMADWIIDERQYTEDNSPYWDYVGGFQNGSFPKSVSTATYSESISAALELARYKGDDTNKEKYKESLQLSLQFLINLQYREDNSFYLDNPEEAIGGFRESIYDNQQRIDYSQHVISTTTKSLENWVY